MRLLDGNIVTFPGTDWSDFYVRDGREIRQRLFGDIKPILVRRAAASAHGTNTAAHISDRTSQ